MDDISLSRQFRRWRLLARMCLLAGIAVLLSLSQIPDGIKHQALTIIGLILIAATFVLYFARANRCPKCRRSFSEASEYKSSETSGLPLFDIIRSCPFCRLNLE